MDDQGTLAIETLARTIWGEARGEGTVGMAAVANVVMNRVHHPCWWGGSVILVCREPWQFSCWNLGDPNRLRMLSANRNDPQFVDALAIAHKAVAGTLADVTGGANSYFAEGTPTPFWASRAVRTVIIGHHEFFRVDAVAPGSSDPEAAPRSVEATSADGLNAAEMARLDYTETGTT